MNTPEKDNCGIRSSLKRIVEFSKSQPTKGLKFFPSAQMPKGSDFACDDCGSVFVTKFLLSLHRTTQCTTLPLACTKCDLRFPNRTNLLQHNRIHGKSIPSNDSDRIESTSSITIHKCDDCDLVFRGSSKFLRHRRLHSGKRAFRCNRCNLGFNWKSNLTRHLKIQCVRSDDLKCEDFNQTKRHQSKHRSCKTRSSKNSSQMEANRFDVCKTEKSERDNKRPIKIKESPPSENETEDPIRTLKNRTLKSLCRQDGTPSRRYVCEHCRTGFKYKSDLLRHLVTHDSVKPFQCEYCDQGFNWKSNLVRHQRRFHFGNKSYRCDKCGVSFTRNYHLLRHQKTHIETDFNGRLEVSSVEGNRRVESKGTEDVLEVYWKSGDVLTIKQEKQPEQPQESPVQRQRRGKNSTKTQFSESETQRRPDEISIGYVKKEPSRRDDYIDIVKDSIGQTVNVKRKKSTVVSSDGDCLGQDSVQSNQAVYMPSLPSTSNPKQSNTKTNEPSPKQENVKLERSPKRRRKCAKYQSRTVPDESIEIISIDTDNSVNTSNKDQYSDVSEDQKSITQEVNTRKSSGKIRDIPLQCDKPNANFSSNRSRSYKNRKKNATDAKIEIKQFPCSYCDRSFSHRSSHFQHERSHDNKPVTCGVCLRSFDRKSLLKRHTMIHTGEKPYQCEVCHKNFRRKSQLIRHKKIHRKPMSYECETCNRRFNRRSILKSHQLIHLEVRPFQCDLCPLSFSQQSILDIHQKVHIDLTEISSSDTTVHSEEDLSFADEDEQSEFSFSKETFQNLDSHPTAGSHTYNTRLSLKQENISYDFQDETFPNPSHLHDQSSETDHDAESESYNQDHYEDYRQTIQRSNSHQKSKSGDATKACQDDAQHSDLQEPCTPMSNTSRLTGVKIKKICIPERKREHCEVDAMVYGLKSETKDESNKHPEKMNFVQGPESQVVVESPIPTPTSRRDSRSNLNHTDVTKTPNARQITIIRIQSEGKGKRRMGEESDIALVKREDCVETSSEDIQLSQINSSRDDDKREICSAYQPFKRLVETPSNHTSESPDGKNHQEIINQHLKLEVGSNQEFEVDSAKCENTAAPDLLSTEVEATEELTSADDSIDGEIGFVSKTGSNTEKDVSEEILRNESLENSILNGNAITGVEGGHEYCDDLQPVLQIEEFTGKSCSELNTSSEIYLQDEGFRDRDLVNENLKVLELDETDSPINSCLDQTNEISDHKDVCQNLDPLSSEEIYPDQLPDHYIEICCDNDHVPCKNTDDQIMKSEEISEEQNPESCKELLTNKDYDCEEKICVTEVLNECLFRVALVDQISHNSETLIKKHLSEQNAIEDIPEVLTDKQIEKISINEHSVNNDVNNDFTSQNCHEKKLSATGNCFGIETFSDPDSSSFQKITPDRGKNSTNLNTSSERDLIQYGDISTTQIASQSEDVNDLVTVSNEVIPIRPNLDHQEKTGSVHKHENIPFEKLQPQLHATNECPDLNDQQVNSLNLSNQGTISFTELGELPGFDTIVSSSKPNVLIPVGSKKFKLPKRSSNVRSVKKRVKRQDSKIDKLLDLFKDISIDDDDYYHDDINQCFKTHQEQNSDDDRFNPRSRDHSENDKSLDDLHCTQYKDVCTNHNSAYCELHRSEPLTTFSDQKAFQLVNEYVGYEKISIRKNVTVEHFVECEEISFDNKNEQIRFVSRSSVSNPAMCDSIRYDPVQIRSSQHFADRSRAQCDETHIRSKEIRKLQDNFCYNQTDPISIRHPGLFTDRNQTQSDESYIRSEEIGKLQDTFRYQLSDSIPVPPEPFTDRNQAHSGETFIRTKEIRKRQDSFSYNQKYFPNNGLIPQSLVRNEEIDNFSVEYEKIRSNTVKQYFNFPMHQDKAIRVPKINDQGHKLFKPVPKNFHEVNHSYSECSQKKVRSGYEKLHREVVRKNQELSLTKQFLCEMCDQCFKRKEDLIRHRFTEHVKNRF